MLRHEPDLNHCFKGLRKEVEKALKSDAAWAHHAKWCPDHPGKDGKVTGKTKPCQGLTSGVWKHWERFVLRAGLSTAFSCLQEKLGEGGTAAAFKTEFRAAIEDCLAHAFDVSHEKCGDHCPFKDGSARASKHADAYVSCAGAQKAIRELLAVHLSDANLDKLVAVRALLAVPPLFVQWGEKPTLCT